MGSMLLPLAPFAVFLLLGLAVLGVILAERYPVPTWGRELRRLRGSARPTKGRVRVVPQEARLEDLLTRDESTTYLGTDSFSGLVDIVERAMDGADRALDAAESRSPRLRRLREVSVGLTRTMARTVSHGVSRTRSAAQVAPVAASRHVRHVVPRVAPVGQVRTSHAMRHARTAPAMRRPAAPRAARRPRALQPAH